MEIEERAPDIDKFLSIISKERDRKIINLLFEGYKLCEISKLVGLSVPGVSVTISKYVRKARRIDELLFERKEIAMSEQRVKRKYAPRVKKDKAAPILSEWSGYDFYQKIQNIEVTEIGRALAAANGATSLAAKLLKLNRTTLVEKIKKLGIAKESYRVAA